VLLWRYLASFIRKARKLNHPECFTNEMYKKSFLAPQRVKGWDTMYSIIKEFHGNNTPCTSAAGCLNIVEGSAEHILVVEKQKANNAKTAEEETIKCAKGEGNFPLAAMKELRQQDIVCDNPLKVQSILQSNKFAKGEANLQLAAAKKLHQQEGIVCDDPLKAQSILMMSNNIPMKNPVIAAKSGAAQMGALNHNYKGNDWTNDQIKQLCELCVAGYGITKIANTIESDVASRRTVHNI